MINRIANLKEQSASHPIRSSAEKGPSGRAEKLCAAGWLFAISSGCSTPNWMSARQNTQKNTADRMVHTRGSGELVWSMISSDQGRVGKSKFRKTCRFPLLSAHVLRCCMVVRVVGVVVQSLVSIAGGGARPGMESTIWPEQGRHNYGTCNSGNVVFRCLWLISLGFAW